MSTAPTLARPVRSPPRTPFGFGFCGLRMTRTWKCTGMPRAWPASQNGSSSGRMVAPTLGIVFSHTPRMPSFRHRSISLIARLDTEAGMAARPMRRSGATLTNSSRQPVVERLHAGELELRVGIGEEVAHHARRAEQDLGIDPVDILLLRCAARRESFPGSPTRRLRLSNAPLRACGPPRRRYRSGPERPRGRTATPPHPRRRARPWAPCRETFWACTSSTNAAARARANPPTRGDNRAP